MLHTSVSTLMALQFTLVGSSLALPVLWPVKIVLGKLYGLATLYRLTVPPIREKCEANAGRFDIFVPYGAVPFD